MLRQLKALARSVLRPPLHAAEVALPHTVLGTEYGGWPLLDTLTPKSPLIYAFGVGEDISFDLAAIERYDARVIAFDPTPRCGAWIARQSLPSNFSFQPIGLADTDGEAQFFAPEESEHVSFSSQPAKASDPALAVTAPVKRLSTIIDELGTGVPDVLKMDIEGFEYGVLTDMIASGLRPGQLLVEFHHRMYDISNERTQTAVKALQDAGYRLFFVSSGGHEYGFVHDSAMSKH